MRWLSPRLLPLHLLGIAVLTACVLMGLWQLGVYGSKQDDSRRDLRTAKPAQLLDVWGPDEPYRDDLSQRPVWVRGRFTGEQILVNRPERQWVVAPLRVYRTHSSLLIVRGWKAGNAAVPAPPKGTVTFRAVLQPGEESRTAFDRATRTIDAVSVAALANVVDGDLFSGYAVTDAGGITSGLAGPVEPAAPTVSWTTGLRNLAYAMQWWLFGLFGLFMWWRMVTDSAVFEPQDPADTVAQ